MKDDRHWWIFARGQGVQDVSDKNIVRNRKKEEDIHGKDPGQVTYHWKRSTRLHSN